MSGSNAGAPLSATPSAQLRRLLRLRVGGRVTGVVGMVVEGRCARAAVGDLIEVGVGGGTEPVAAEVIGLRGGSVLLVPLGDVRGVAVGDRLEHLGVAATIGCGPGMLGRVVDARGRPIDGAGPIPGPWAHQRLYADPPPPLRRQRIDAPLGVGIRAIDGLLTLGCGQRIGIMAGAGVGKSRLIGMITAATEADVNVVALIGERGREVGDFLHDVLTPEARRRSVVVVATSDQSPLERMRGAFVATTLAEHFASAGKQVLLVMDSLTRFAMAQRELGLSAGEPPTTKGYTPSVFSSLPRLLERAGRFDHGGSITGIYTVLVEGDDLADPIADAARSILDGHIVLSRDLAARAHFPAIDVLPSISRVASAVLSPAQLEIATRMRGLISHLREAEELIAIGAYVAGAAPELDRALHKKAAVLEFLRQGANDATPMMASLKRMADLVGDCP